MMMMNNLKDMIVFVMKHLWGGNLTLKNKIGIVIQQLKYKKLKKKMLKIISFYLMS